MAIKKHLISGSNFILCLCLILSFYSLSLSSAHAQSPTEYNFGQFGYSEQILHAPFGTTSYSFGLPAEWKILDGSSIQLDLVVYFDVQNPSISEGDKKNFGGQLQVIFNEIKLTTIILENNGSQTINIPLPLESMKPLDIDGQYRLVVSYTNEDYCLYGTTATIVIQSSSKLIIPHQDGPIPTDLAKLPYPIYIKNSILPGSVFLVIPNQPSPAELKSAFTTAASFGQMTDGALQLSIVPLGYLTSEISRSQNLIFVGKLTGFPILDGITLPISLVEWTNKFPDDGVIYQVISPWNQVKDVLFITGSTDAAVVKAAQALGSGMIFGNIQPDLAVIQQVNPLTTAKISTVDMTLADLGYESETITLPGFISREYSFFVPSGKEISGDAYINLKYSHSKLLDFNRSEMLLTLNGKQIGNFRYSNDSAQGGNEKIIIPRDAVGAGINKLVLETELTPKDLCTSIQGIDIWLTIRGDSQIHLPLSVVPEGVTRRVIDLGFYPKIFTISPYNQNFTFIVPPNNMAAWQVGNTIAFSLGTQMNWPVSEIEVAYADNIPDTVLQDRDIIIIGRPSEQPILNTLGDTIPIPFDAGSDLPKTLNSLVVYRIVQGDSVGIVELFASPWNFSNVVLAVLGNTDEGIQWSGSALINPSIHTQLMGDYAVIHSKDILSGNSKMVAVINPLTTPKVEDIKPSVPKSSTVNSKPIWMILVLSIVLILIIILIVYLLIQAWRRNK